MNDTLHDASTADLPIPPAGPAHSLFDAAFREHHGSLLQYIRRRVGSEVDASDIAQEAYLRVLRYRENQDLHSLKALLYRIAANLVAMRARVARRHHTADHVSVDDLPVAANDPPQDQQVADEEQLARLLAVIQELPAKCRQVFVLSRFHDLSYPEIAARCGISVKMVEKHITKALAICRAGVGGERP